MSKLTVGILTFLFILVGWSTRCSKVDKEIVDSQAKKEADLTDERSLSIQCRYDTTSVRSLVKQFQIRFGEASSVMDTALDFYDS